MRETRDLTADEAVALAKQQCIAGQHQTAVSLCRGALRIDPKNAEGLNQLGVALVELGLRKKGANFTLMSDAIKARLDAKQPLEAEEAAFVTRLIHEAVERGKELIPAEYYEALYRFDRSIVLRRRDPATLSNRGMILAELGNNEEAIDEFRKAIHHRPNYPIGWTNLANTLERVGRYQEALVAIEKAIALDPEHALAYYNKGVILLRLNRHHEALAAQNKSIELAPDSYEAIYNRGVTALALGWCKEGFRDYEARISTVGHQPYYVAPKAPRWQGEPLEGKSIILHSEQGLGDTIQFMRYVPMVMERNPAKIQLILHRAARTLAEGDAALAGCEVLQPGMPMPVPDYHAALLSLPHIFGTTLDNIPAPWAPSEAVFGCEDCNRWGGIIGDNTTRGYALRVGLCWSGNWQHKNDEHRSIALKQFSRILNVRGAKFYSLQKDVRPMDEAEFKGLDVMDLAPHLTDMRQTAHAMGWLDLVISVDTAVAHMAASMGTETWILVPWFRTDWRWLLDREDSPWYPDAKLFRQPEFGNWDSVLGRVRKELDRRVGVTAVAA